MSASRFRFRAWDGQRMDTFMAGCRWDASISNGKKTIMQSTGLQDKNGVEIFEGDVVNDLGNAGPDAFKSGIVVWHNDFNRWGFVPYLSYPCGWARELRGKYEVIGNIYEHAHLIEREAAKND